jgi:hypothetical protein
MTQQIPHPAPPPWLTGVTKWPDELRAGRLLGIERAAPDRDSLRPGSWWKPLRSRRPWARSAPSRALLYSSWSVSSW